MSAAALLSGIALANARLGAVHGSPAFSVGSLHILTVPFAHGCFPS